MTDYPDGWLTWRRRTRAETIGAAPNAMRRRWRSTTDQIEVHLLDLDLRAVEQRLRALPAAVHAMGEVSNPLAVRLVRHEQDLHRQRARLLRRAGVVWRRWHRTRDGDP